MLTIANLVPKLLNNNGDAENARVLAQRAQWGGVSARVLAVNTAAELPSEVDAVVLGSGSDSALEATREILLEMQEQLRVLGTAGVPVLAIGTGFELLSWGIELRDKSIEGLGILPGHAKPVSERAVGDLVVKSPRFGTLVGFENHARGFVGAEASPLGRIIFGVGNGKEFAQEGAQVGTVIGTHLHGPVLAKNPKFADALLAIMTSRVGLDYKPGKQTQAVDEFAKAARNSQLKAANLTQLTEN